MWRSSLAGIVVAPLALTGCERAPAPQLEAKAVSLQYTVSGMTCDGCARSIEATVERLEGVTDCDASFETGSLLVQATSPAENARVLQAVRDMKFTINPVTDAAHGKSPGSALPSVPDSQGSATAPLPGD